MDSSASSAPDLTQRAPRSPRLRLGGYVLLPRILDKGRALLAGKLGEYKHSAQGMNRHFFNFTGVQFEAFMAELANDKRDGEMLAWVQANSPSPRQPWEIAAWSAYQERRGPDSDAETWDNFGASVRKHNPTREDIQSYFDLLDLDDFTSFGGQA